MSKLLIDFESRSKASLPDVGQYRYARHGSTEIMCIGYKVIGEKGDANLLTYPDIYLNENTKDFKYALKHCEKVVAHNVPFEYVMWNHCLVQTTGLGRDLPHLPSDKFVCTLATSNILALPRALDKVGAVLGLKMQKNVVAKKLLMSMCKPRKAINDIKAWREWIEDDASLNGLYEYCKDDVRSEEELFLNLMSNTPWTKNEYEIWVLDQVINQRGFEVDIPLVKRITELIAQEEKELSHDLKRLTFGWVGKASQNKNLQEYLKSQGLDLPNLQAKTVDDTIKELERAKHVSNEDVLSVLRIKKALSKSSTSKYQAFLDRADDDRRVRDNLMYHGASTGRWAGMGVQPQNFPRGTIKITPDVLEDIRSCDIQTLRMLYARPMDVFSSALRNMIVASKGKEFFCADFSSIEARVLLWVAEDAAGLKEYELGLDTYISMAETVYGIPYKEIETEYKAEGYSERRQLGKKIILACFDKDTKVLTDKGWVKIAEVTQCYNLWDGVEWVKHEGVICQGLQKTINFYGVNVTPNHKILTLSGWVEAYQVLEENIEYLRSVTSLVKLPFVKLFMVKGAGLSLFRYLVTVGRKEITAFIFLTCLTRKAHVVMSVLKKLRVILINSILNTPLLCRTMSTVDVCLTVLVRFFQDAITKKVKCINITALGVLKSTRYGVKIGRCFLNTLRLLKGGNYLFLNWTGLKLIKDMNPVTYGSFLSQKICLIVERFFKCKKKSNALKNVYDILNAGPRNRFTILTDIGPMIVHNCGYQMGVKKFKESCESEGLLLPDSMYERAHKAFRQKYPKIPQVWFNLERTAIMAVINKGKKFSINKTTWFVKGDFLFCRLPSGRRLAYYKPEVRKESTSWGTDRFVLYYWTTDSKTKQWVNRASYGGLLTENVVQAISRDCMAIAMKRVEDAGFEVLLTVHDEVLCERAKGVGTLKEFKDLMSARPDWGLDIPLKVGGWVDERYRK